MRSVPVWDASECWLHCKRLVDILNIYIYIHVKVKRGPNGGFALQQSAKLPISVSVVVWEKKMNTPLSSSCDLWAERAGNPHRLAGGVRVQERGPPVPRGWSVRSDMCESASPTNDANPPRQKISAAPKCLITYFPWLHRVAPAKLISFRLSRSKIRRLFISQLRAMKDNEFDGKR